MPSTDEGRRKILSYLQENNITQNTLAKLYGLVKQDVSDFLNGKLNSPRANAFLARVIEDFGIR